ncbi:MAG: membrane protein insertase YidC, partial [Acidobacteria bacterium]|nr:membrane protein insertase YidC [Acidobacteriota bacterium]
EKPQPVAHLAVGWTSEAPAQLFVGPKRLDVLEQIRPAGTPGALDELVDFGTFAFIAKPIFFGMRWIHEHLAPNYGWAIVLLTIVINTALFPLQWKSRVSAWRMQKIAPQMRAIQEKYKKYRFNDPRKQQMQQELMGLYREHGVNPLGGCFPLLLQLPFFYAFYKVLVIAIELRHAPWFGWIHDLSARDPYYILPVVMTLTMYISTKMTPMTTTDPAQQKMMTLMPLFFGVLFLTFSSGLVLYWLMSNLAGIGQQYWINRYQRARATAEKPARKGKKKP